MKNIKKILTVKAEKIDRELNKLFDLKETELSPTLSRAMEYTVFSGGKRIRPVLTLLTAEMLNGNTDAALKAGSALELIHSYSLIHDDLPSMDDDDFRRGKAANHRVFGEGIAVLAGDALLTYAFEILSALKISAEKRIKIISLISTASGYQGMVGGQVLDLEGENKNLDLEEMQKVHRGKTGALIKASVLTGAYCSDTDKDEIDALTDYSENLGVTFQIVDDLLDVVGDEEKLGKAVGSDDKLNKSTYPKLLGIDGAKKAAEKYALAAADALDVFGDEARHLKELVQFVLYRQS
ncbi:MULTISPECIES: polyprenyl synthetase family protein [unclassified Halanaerobium]|uniref:polyprenyl synthetase family protein n=1 Tax=unclassified Halanaerobium TaxID=2641197 RepID=UPI000DF222ED|nr:MULTISPECIES: farnesyl diphosphate synthase [unclassified Halanaerobium]RCW50550.1 geranylgeranyl diphosphate synthase type II [Halanaerobium sp. MA284_MarDTE_T2]RCW82182.1 geranylgeranyl diphosphate synthase type II [Halanaerobium sp. DL-01]